MRSKKNKKKLIIAIVFGIVATFSLFNYMNSQKAKMEELSRKMQEQKSAPMQSVRQEMIVKEPEKITAVIAAENISVGDFFTLSSLKIEEYSQEELPPVFFRNRAMVVGKKASRNIAAGGFITPAEVQAEDVDAINIPNNSRAVTIPVDKFRGLASHIKIGSRVDIIKVSNPPEFIAQNISVISFEEAVDLTTTTRRGEAVETDPASLTAKKASAITFLVPIDIVTPLIDAMFAGQLQIITRNSSDEKIIVAEMELPSPPLSGDISSLPKLPEISVKEDLPPPRMPPPDPRKIEIIKASNISTLEFDSTSFQSSGNKRDDSLSDQKLRDLLDMIN